MLMACKIDYVQDKAKGTIKITVPTEMLSEQYGKVLKDNLPKIRLKGFRPGHAPVQMIEKMYGRQFKIDSLNSIISEEYKKYIEENKVPVISEPSVDISDKELSFDKDIDVTFTVELTPFCEPGDVTTVTADRIEVRVNDKDVDDELNKYRKQRGTLEPKDGPAEKDDYVDAEIKGFDETGAVLKTLDRMVRIGEDLNGLKLDDDLTGMKKGDKKEIVREFGDDIAISEFKGKKVRIELDIHEVKGSKLPELNDEFAKGFGQYDTLDAFKAELRKKLDQYAKDYERKHNLDSVYDKLIGISDIDIPPSMLAAQAERMIDIYARNLYGMNRQGLESILKATNSDIGKFKEAITPSVRKDLQVEVLLGKIIDKNAIAATEEDIAAFYVDEAGKTGKTVDEVKNDIAEKKLEENISYFIKMRKAEDYLLNSAKKGKTRKLDMDKLAEFEKEENEKKTAAADAAANAAQTEGAKE